MTLSETYAEMAPRIEAAIGEPIVGLFVDDENQFHFVAKSGKSGRWTPDDGVVELDTPGTPHFPGFGEARGTPDFGAAIAVFKECFGAVADSLVARSEAQELEHLVNALSRLDGYEFEQAAIVARIRQILDIDD